MRGNVVKLYSPFYIPKSTSIFLKLSFSSTKASSSSLKQTAGSNKQQQPSKTNEPPRLYGVEKWNDLRLVLKRTPEKVRLVSFGLVG